MARFKVSIRWTTAFSSYSIPPIVSIIKSAAFVPSKRKTSTTASNQETVAHIRILLQQMLEIAWSLEYQLHLYIIKWSLSMKSGSLPSPWTCMRVWICNDTGGESLLATSNHIALIYSVISVAIAWKYWWSGCVPDDWNRTSSIELYPPGWNCSTQPGIITGLTAHSTAAGDEYAFYRGNLNNVMT